MNNILYLFIYMQYLIGFFKYIIVKEKDHKQSLIVCENEFETDYITFLNFLENRKNKLKKENDNLLKCKEIHEEAKEKYYKELAKFKKLNEDLEKKI